MYVCICKGITEKQIQDAITAKLNATPKEILKTLGVGTDCGTCIEDAVNQMMNCSNLKIPAKTDSSNNS
jgi:bacterioferritin-associated ferredoxin